MSLRFLIALLLACFAVTSSLAQSLIVKPGDSVQVVCLEEPSLSREYAITRDGFIVMQFIGAVSVAGLKEKDAAAKIAATLIEQRILPKATVTLKVIGAAKGGLVSFSGAVSRAGDVFPRAGLRLSDVVKEAKPTAAADLARVRIVGADGKTILVNYLAYDGKDVANNPELRAGDRVIFDLIVKNPDISVVGMVARPGVVPYSRGMTLVDALKGVGGLTRQADPKAIRIERDSRALPEVAADAAFALEPGDRIFVPQLAAMGSVTVSGQVNNPGTIPLRAGMTVVDAIRAAGGPKQSANLKRVKVKRAVDGKPKNLEIDLDQVAMGMRADMPVRDADAIEIGGVRKRGPDLRTIGGIVLLGLFFGLVKF